MPGIDVHRPGMGVHHPGIDVHLARNRRSASFGISVQDERNTQAGWDVEVALPNGVVLRFRG
jgi:hypothetical protein